MKIKLQILSTFLSDLTMTLKLYKIWEPIVNLLHELACENENILFTNTGRPKTISTTFRLKASSGRGFFQGCFDWNTLRNKPPAQDSRKCLKLNNCIQYFRIHQTGVWPQKMVPIARILPCVSSVNRTRLTGKKHKTCTNRWRHLLKAHRFQKCLLLLVCD